MPKSSIVFFLIMPKFSITTFYKMPKISTDKHLEMPKFSVCSFRRLPSAEGGVGARAAAVCVAGGLEGEVLVIDVADRLAEQLHKAL